MSKSKPRQDFDAIIIGGGISGMFMVYRLRSLGMKVRAFENGSDVGGTWYWNRYPGARFDSESWTYGYTFSKELLQEWDWTENYSPQPHTLKYLQYVADKFDLRRDMTFNANVVAAHFDDSATMWTITLQDGRRFSAPILVTGLGPLSAHTLPNIDGRDEYQGQAVHTARWPKEGVDLNGKTVGIIGTGASAIQAIPEIAKQAGQLTVFQRTPNWAAPLHNAKISKAEMEEIKTRYDEIYASCRDTVAYFIHNPDPRGTFEVTEEERVAHWEKLYASPGFGIWLGNFRDILTDEKANALMTEWAANKVRQRVRDPVIAERLIPKNHGFGTRRLPLESGYFETYNRDNVELVSVLEEPIKRITKTGVKTSNREFNFDILIYATGFDGVAGPYDRIDFRGPDGRKLIDDWKILPRTFLGVQAEGFPNLFMVLGPHTARGNIPRNIEEIADWVVGLIKFMRDKGYQRCEPRPGPVESYTQEVLEVDALLLSSKVPSWQTGVNRNVEGKSTPRPLGYNGGAPRYRKKAEKVAAGGYQEFRFL